MIPGRARVSNGDRKKSYRLGEEPLTERPSCACLQNDSYGIGPFACARPLAAGHQVRIRALAHAGQKLGPQTRPLRRGDVTV